jgi:hypothetical protein
MVSAKVVECLPGEQKTLFSTPRTVKSNCKAADSKYIELDEMPDKEFKSIIQQISLNLRKYQKQMNKLRKTVQDVDKNLGFKRQRFRKRSKQRS